jgi:hypothetical protein
MRCTCLPRCCSCACRRLQDHGTRLLRGATPCRRPSVPNITSVAPLLHRCRLLSGCLCARRGTGMRAVGVPAQQRLMPASAAAVRSVRLRCCRAQPAVAALDALLGPAVDVLPPRRAALKAALLAAVALTQRGALASPAQAAAVRASAALRFAAPPALVLHVSAPPDVLPSGLFRTGGRRCVSAGGPQPYS